MITRTSRLLGALALTSVVALTGCARGCTTSRPPIQINPSMDDQPKVRPQTASTFFHDGASMRQPVPGTVPIGGLKEDTAFFTGKGADGTFVATIPVTVDEALLERGRQRYAIYCQPCHDARGDGKGIMFQRANVATPTFHQERILKHADGFIFDVITNGLALMPSYRASIPPADRWAIIAAVRELQRKRQPGPPSPKTGSGEGAPTGTPLLKSGSGPPPPPSGSGEASPKLDALKSSDGGRGRR